MNWLKYLVGLSAIIIAAAAAYFSISGLSKLFAGSTLAIIIMASSLEFAKLVAATYLKQKWDIIKGFAKYYLSLAIIILMIITSAGIYGFLTSAYQTTSDQLHIIEKQVTAAQLKKSRFQDQLTGYTAERSNLSNSISDLSKGLSNNVIKYTDKDGNEVTTTSSATRRTLEAQLNDMKNQRDITSSKIDVLNDSITNIDLRIINIESDSELNAEVGPLKYISKLTGKPMDVIVNWFALSIVLVFDPLAIALIIAFNGLLIEERSTIKNKGQPEEKEYEIYGDDNSRYALDIEETLLSEKIPVGKGVEVTDRNELEKKLQTESKLVQKTDIVDDDREPILYQDDASPVIPENTTIVEKPVREGLRLEPGGEIVGYDTNDDGLIDEYTARTSIQAREIQGKQPYYTRPTFNWNDKSTWINDQAAVNYWLKFKRPAQEKNDDLIKKY